MGRRRCDACGRRVEVPGGVGDFWDFGSLEKAGPGGLTLELGDGYECFLCFDCIAELPDDPTREDVRAVGGE